MTGLTVRFTGEIQKTGLWAGKVVGSFKGLEKWLDALLGHARKIMEDRARAGVPGPGGRSQGVYGPGQGYQDQCLGAQGQGWGGGCPGPKPGKPRARARGASLRVGPGEPGPGLEDQDQGQEGQGQGVRTSARAR